jgi:hypothetical protein
MADSYDFGNSFVVLGARDGNGDLEFAPRNSGLVLRQMRAQREEIEASQLGRGRRRRRTIQRAHAVGDFGDFNLGSQIFPIPAPAIANHMPIAKMGRRLPHQDGEYLSKRSQKRANVGQIPLGSMGVI